MESARIAWKPVVSKSDLQKIAVDSNQPWITLPVLIDIPAVIPVQLSQEEVEIITAYGDSYFDKAFIDSRPSQWASSKGANTRNPNTTGIKGEWAAMKYFTNGECDLNEFLRDRPWRIADMGDVLIVNGKKGEVFDYKTATRKEPISVMVGNSPIGDMYMAAVASKVAWKQFLHGFIFCVNNESENMIYLMGWMPAKQFLDHAQVITKGTRIPNSYRTYDADMLFVPYRRLHPIAKLKERQQYPLTHNQTVMLKGEWSKNQNTYDAYAILNNLRDLPLADSTS